MNLIFNRVGDGIAVVFIALFFISLTRVEYQACYLIGYVLCTWFWSKRVEMTRFETLTVGLVWPMAMFHYGFMVLLYRFDRGIWVFDFISVKQATLQRQSQHNGETK